MGQSISCCRGPTESKNSKLWHRNSAYEVPSIKIGEANATDPLTAKPSCKDDPAPNGVCRRSPADDLHVFGRAQPSSNVSRGGTMHAQAEANDCKSCGLQQVRHSRSSAAVASDHGRQM